MGLKTGLNSRLHTYLKQSLPSRRRDRSCNDLDADLQGYEYSTLTTLGSRPTKSKNLFPSEKDRHVAAESGSAQSFSRRLHQENVDLSSKVSTDTHVQCPTSHTFSSENISDEEGLQVRGQVEGSSMFSASSRHNSVVSDNSSAAPTPIFDSWPDQWRQSMRESIVFPDDASCYSADEDATKTLEEIGFGQPTAHAALSGWGNSPELAQKLRMSVARRSQYVDVGLKSELRESVSSVM